MNNLVVNLKRLVILIKILGLYQAINFLVQDVIQINLIKVNVRGIKTPLFCRSSGSDRHSLMQTFWRKGVDVAFQVDPQIIVDAGAYVGYTSVFFANKYPTARIIAIEPDEENCELFRKNCHSYPNIHLIQGAIWDSDANLKIQNPKDYSWEFRVEEVSQLTPNSIKGITIPQIITLAKVQHIDILKLDIEGTEKRLFTSDVSSWIGRTENLIIELHDRYIEGCAQAALSVSQKYGFVTTNSGEYLVLMRKTPTNCQEC